MWDIGDESINIRKGLFRLWVVGSILFAVYIGVVSYSGIRDDFKSAHTDTIAKQLGGYEWLPVKCILPPPPGYSLRLGESGMQRGLAGTDYNYSEVDGLCWYRMPNFRRLYPEYHDLTDNDLAERLYAEADRPPKHFYPWQKLASTIAIAMEAPLAVLGLGWGLLWAASDWIARLEAYLRFRAWLRWH